MRYLTVNEVVEIHQRIIQRFGGLAGLRDLGALEAAIAQPRMTFSGEELYPTIVEKAAALGFSIVQNHPFVDGNKRAGHAAMETFLLLNRFEIEAPVDEQEKIILQVASGELGRQGLADWLGTRIIEAGEEND
jgi:death-on-curing protein